MRYAVQVATETETSTYYPEEIDRRKNRNQKRKKTQIQKGRERSTEKCSGQARKQLKARHQEGKHTNKGMRNFSQIAGSHSTRGVWNRDKNIKYNLRTPSLRTRGKQKKSRAGKKRKERKDEGKQKTEAETRSKNAKKKQTKDTNRDTRKGQTWTKER